MIRRIVDFALNKRLFILAFAILLLAAGVVAFHRLPVDAYPDVADNYVEIITQWPGISAEQIEQQVTIPLEIVMNGIPHIVHLRSFSLFGLSDLKLIFDDEEDNFRNRERVLERFSQVALPPGVVPTMGTDSNPCSLTGSAPQAPPCGRGQGARVDCGLFLSGKPRPVGGSFTYRDECWRHTMGIATTISLRPSIVSALILSSCPQNQRTW
jgi:hypothetical protein